MADDPNPALRAELQAAIDVLAPQIRGLTDLDTISLSSDLKAAIDQQIVVRQRRSNLLSSVISTLDRVIVARTALEADGYPTLPTAIIAQTLFTELKGDNSDIDAAVGVFAPQATIAIGTDPTFTPQPAPTKPGP
jgi:hypothetical protein